MKDTCIVTGGAGFIGSHLCEKLIKEGYSVICVDNLSTGQIKNIDPLRNSPQFTFIKTDITEAYPGILQKYIDNCQYIFHLASPASPNKKSKISYYAKPIETLLVNSLGTYKLLDSLKVSKAKFLFASTSEIYGDPLIHPQNEKYWGNVNPTGERSCYDEAKRVGEAFTFAYLRKYNCNVRILRIFNTYGPGMHRDDGRAVVEFIVNALRGQPLTIFGDGSQTRSFCFVSDMVEGIYKAMFVPQTRGEILNLGNPDELTILDIAKEIKQLTNSNSELKFAQLPQDDPKRRCPDITKANKLLDWFPLINLKDGLKKTIDYFKNE